MTTALLLSALVILWSAALPKAGHGADNRRAPNIILILADDLGFSDLGCYGSEILTPNLDRLAKEGLRFTQFYNTARCCPTRAALLTGLYPHQAGVGHMTEDHHKPGYRGNLNQQCATIAELLQEAGYQTMMCGKWHVTRHTGPEGPRHTWPLQRGFEKFFGTIAGGGSYFDPVTLCRGNQFVRAEGDFYYTEAISQQAAEFIGEAARSDKPFFLYVAYTAPHWPLHARAADIARYRGRYGIGWDQLRQHRYKRMIEMGIIKATWPLAPRDERVKPWIEVPYRTWHERRMEVYAAQVDAMDQGIGRILEKLRQVNKEENTLILFLSDNGGCAEEIAATWKNPVIPAKTRDGRGVQVGNNPGILPGPEDTFQSCGVPWANVSNTPFRLYKHWVHEGGIATPLIVHWPAVIRPKNRLGDLTDQLGHVVDIMATCLEAADTRYPKAYKGFNLPPTEGESLVPIFRGEVRQPRPIFWEHEGNRAVRDGRWKLVSKYPGPWELYDMEADRTEMNNLAGQHPEVVQRLEQLYDQWAARANVLPWGQRK